MKLLIHIHRRILGDSDITGVIAAMCSKNETTIVLEGAAIFSIGVLTDGLAGTNASVRLCVEDSTGLLPLQREAERISIDDLPALIASSDHVFSL
jgi:hypothetical protein